MTHAAWRTRIYAAAGAAAMLLIFGVARAATIDFTADATVSLSSPAVSFTILSGSGATSFITNGTSVVVTVPTGTIFTLTSVDRELSVSGTTTSTVITTLCQTNGVAKVEVAAANTQVQTLTIAPLGNRCSPSGGGERLPDIIAFPPVVYINGNAASTVSARVTLTLAATNASYMMISNTPDFKGGAWESYATSTSWTLSPGEGVRKVYAKFRDSAGAISAVASDSIVSERPPAAPPGRDVRLEKPSRFARDLKIGSQGADVEALQEILERKQFLKMPAGVARGFFGRVTREALASYQRSLGIAPAAGYFGPLTRTRVLAEDSPARQEVIAPEQTIAEKIQALMKQVQELQKLLDKIRSAGQ